MTVYDQQVRKPADRQLFSKLPIRKEPLVPQSGILAKNDISRRLSGYGYLTYRSR